MKNLFLCVAFVAAPLFAQVDLFTGENTEGAAQPPALEAPEISAPPEVPEAPGEPSLVIVLGRDGLPPFAYPANTRGFKGSIDWKQVPDLGYNKEEIQSISIVQRQLKPAENEVRAFGPALWHFKAENWETVYSGSIPYLEDLMFLEDALRVRLTTKVEVKRLQNEEGYHKDQETGVYGLYRAVNGLNPKAVSRIIIVSAGDNREINRLRLAFENASDTPPITLPPSTPALGAAPMSAAAARADMPAGVSIFEKAAP